MTTLDMAYPAIVDLFREHIAPKRSESAAFLIWYFENYYRLDEVEAVDSVCDQPGDKGVDGIYLNEAEGAIDVFQARILQRVDATIGDTALRDFVGALAQFNDRTSLQTMIRTAGAAQIAQLATRLELLNKVGSYDVRGYFLTNVELDSNGQAYLAGGAPVTFIGRDRLQKTYISDKRTPTIPSQARFDIAGYRTAEYIVDSSTRAVIAPIKARELVGLQGISDQSLFDFNVRGPLGQTQVNRDIVKSIKDATTHRLFPLFHNGVTIICQKLEQTAEKLTVDNYFVVNGCQSLNSLYENQTAITEDLRILTKFVQVEVGSDLSVRITKYSNNQNGVKSRDFKSNHPMHIRLQNEMRRDYSGAYDFEIKRGETPATGEVISNETAGLNMIAFDLKEPWATHRKYQMFEEKHSDVFGRPEVTADRVVMLQVIADEIADARGKIENVLFGKYALTQHAIMYMVREILEKDALGREVLKSPERFVRATEDRERFAKCIRAIVADVITDVNAEVKEVGEAFDYRGKLRDSDWVKELAKKVVTIYEKTVNRGRLESFEQLWKKEPEPTAARPTT
jgi:hypothetical protein